MSLDNDRDRLRRLANLDSMDNVIAEFEYTHLDPAGNRRLVTDMIADPMMPSNLLTAENWYGYDPLHRLVFEDRINVNPPPGAPDYGHHHTYDKAGNRIGQTEGPTSTGGFVRGYTPDERDRLTRMNRGGSPAVSTDYLNDINGNRTREIDRIAPVTTDYEWDEDDRLAGFTRTAGTDGTGAVLDSAAYEYDADGNRIAMTDGAGGVTRFLVDTNNPTGYAQVVRETDAAGVETARYIYGDDLLAELRPDTGGTPAAVAIHYHYDALGSTRALTDESGSLLGSLSYEGYGLEISTSGNTDTSYRFTGEQYDGALDQYYLRARYMDTRTGRFTALDPYDGPRNPPLELNNYSYANGQPIGNVDPSGEISVASLGSSASGLSVLAQASWGASFQPLPCSTCGPDITRPLIAALLKLRQTFNAWPPSAQKTRCDAISSLVGGKVANSWDIFELSTVRSDTVSDENGVPVTTRDYYGLVPPGCATGRCAGSVRVQRECHPFDGVNYVVFGSMMKLCGKSKQDVLNLVDLAISVRFATGGGKNPVTNEDYSVSKRLWALAGYGGWPTRVGRVGGIPRRYKGCKPCQKPPLISDFKIAWHNINF